MKTLFGAVSALALAFSGAPAMAQTAAPAPAAPVATVDADPALWVVKDDDTTIYLFGTVHVLKPGLSWFDEAVKTAFDKSDELVLEMIEPDAAKMQQIVISKAMDPAGKPLSLKLAEADRADYIKAMTDLGVPYQGFEPFKPWMAAITLGVLPLGKLGYDPNSGAEKVLSAAAKSAGKKLGELESAEMQIGFFDGLTEAQQIAYLNATVDELPKFGATMDTMVGMWAKGDPEALGGLMNESLKESPEVGKILLDDRNARWADWIKTRLDTPGTVFVAVGAGHLAGNNSVQDMLKSRKVKVTRVKY